MYISYEFPAFIEPGGVEHLCEVRLGRVEYGLLAFLLIPLDREALLLAHKLTVDSVHGLGPDTRLTLLVLQRPIVLIHLRLIVLLVLLLVVYRVISQNVKTTV